MTIRARAFFIETAGCSSVFNSALGCTKVALLTLYGQFVFICSLYYHDDKNVLTINLMWIRCAWTRTSCALQKRKSIFTAPKKKTHRDVDLTGFASLENINNYSF